MQRLVHDSLGSAKCVQVKQSGSMVGGCAASTLAGGVPVREVAKVVALFIALEIGVAKPVIAAGHG